MMITCRYRKFQKVKVGGHGLASTPGSTKKGRGTSTVQRRPGRGDVLGCIENKFGKRFSGLDKNALINIVMTLIDEGHVSMETVNGQVSSNIDVGPIIETLDEFKDAIFKAMPNLWKFGGGSDAFQRNDFAYKRCSTANSAFKKLLQSHVADLKNLDDAKLK